MVTCEKSSGDMLDSCIETGRLSPLKEAKMNEEPTEIEQSEISHNPETQFESTKHHQE